MPIVPGCSRSKEDRQDLRSSGIWGRGGWKLVLLGILISFLSSRLIGGWNCDRVAIGMRRGRWEMFEEIRRVGKHERLQVFVAVDQQVFKYDGIYLPQQGF